MTETWSGMTAAWSGRTRFLIVGCALLLGLALAQGGESGDDAGASLPVAVQMYTLRDYGPLDEQMALAASVGYRAIEIIGTHDVSAEEMNELLDRHDLEVVSAHVNLNVLRDDLEGVIAYHRAIGNDTIVMPWLGDPDRPGDAAGWRALGEELGGIGARLRDEGMRLAYHNHEFELREVDGRPVIDHLLEGAEPEDLSWQADVAWIARGGQDPAEMLSRHAGRIVSIHAKDNAAPGEGQDEGGFADVGHGVLDWDGILAAAEEAGVETYIVEHDQPADHERTIRRAYEFLVGELGERE